MAVTKQQAIEIMKARGYTQVSEAGNGKWIGFSRDINGIWISAKVDLERESVSLSGGILKMLCELNTVSFDLSHHKFEEYEKMLYFYATVCVVIDTFTEDETFIHHTLHSIIKEEKPKPEKKDIKTRKREFWDKVAAYGKEKSYSKEMCLKFYNYWSEMNEGGKKMRFEMQQVFEVKGRMRTWHSKDQEFVGKTKNFIEQKIEKQDKEKAVSQVINKEELF